MGAELDGELELGGLSAGFEVHLRGIRHELRQLRAQMAPRVPTFHPLAGGVVAGVFTYHFIYLDGPTSSDAVWELRRLVVGSTDPFATPAGTVIAFIVPNGFVSQNSNIEPMFPELLEPASVIPNSLLYGTGQAIVLPGQKIALCIKGAAAGQAFYAAGLAIGYDLKTWTEAQY